MTTLVIGARGAVGRHVLDQLVAAGEPVRASVRKSAAADFPAEVAVVEADLTQPDTLKIACDGVRKVFLYAPSHGVEGFVEAARGAGVEHVVVLSSGSVLLPYAQNNALAVEHRGVEQELADSGLHVTPIRPLVLANNALNWSYPIRSEGTVQLVHPEAVMAPVHERDIAAVAVAALTGAAGPEASAMLTGGELLSQRRQVELIGKAIGTNIRVEELSEERARAVFGRFEESDIVEAIIELIVAATKGGSPATTTVQDVLRRAPIPFAQWTRDHLADFA